MTDSTVETELVRLGELLAKVELTKNAYEAELEGGITFAAGRAGNLWANARENMRNEAGNALPTLLPYIATLQARIAEAEAENARLRQALSGSYLFGDVTRSDDRGGPPIVKKEPAAKFLAPNGDVG